MNTWEEFEPQDLNNCPEKFAFHDDIQRTLLNSDGNIAIGDRIYHYSSNGEILELPLDCDCVIQLQKSHTTPDCARVKRGTPGPLECNSDYYLPQQSAYDFEGHQYLHDYYIEWDGGWLEGQTDTKVSAGFIVYKKKHNNYKKHRCGKHVKAWGEVYINDNNNCIQRNDTPFGPEIYKRRKKIVVKQSWSCDDYGVRYWHSTEFHGLFENYQDGYANSLEGVQ
jgi:hypothetical protein